MRAPPPPRDERSRTPALDGVRGAACAGVLVLHAWMFDHGDAGGAKNALDLALGELRLGVPLFFVLSGFLIYRPFVAAALDGRRPPRLGRYALRRAARILPGYWAAVLGAFALLTALDHPHVVGVAELPRFLLFAQNQSTATLNRLDPPMWTLAVEASFYVLVPLVGLAVARVGRARTAQAALPAALLALGAALTAAAELHAWPETLTTSLLGNLSPFAAGALAAALLHGRRGPGRRAGLALLVAGAALVGADAAWHSLALGSHHVRALIGDLPAALGFAAVVSALAAAPLRARALTTPPLATLGTLSFGVYLWHFPAIYTLRTLHLWPANLAGAIGATLAFTLPPATISWLALERPALRWASARSGRARARTTRRGACGPTRTEGPAAIATSPSGAAVPGWR